MATVKMELLVCPICKEIPEMGILYQCKNGHSLCSKKCSNKVTQQCPHCMVVFETKKIRNRAMGDLVRSLQMGCPYEPAGCEQKMLRKDEILAHAKSCEFRPLEFCKLAELNNCEYNSSGSANGIFHHIQLAHNYSLVKSNVYKVSMNHHWSFMKQNSNFDRSMLFDIPTPPKSNGGGVVVSGKYFVHNWIDSSTETFNMLCAHFTPKRSDECPFLVTLEVIAPEKCAKWSWTGWPTWYKNYGHGKTSPPFRVQIRNLVELFAKDDEAEIKLYYAVKFHEK